MICLSKAKSKLSQLYLHTDQVQPISGQCFNFSPSEDVRKALEQNWIIGQDSYREVNLNSSNLPTTVDSVHVSLSFCRSYSPVEIRLIILTYHIKLVYWLKILCFFRYSRYCLVYHVAYARIPWPVISSNWYSQNIYN